MGWVRSYDVLAGEPVEEALAGTPLHRLHLAGAANRDGSECCSGVRSSRLGRKPVTALVPDRRTDNR